MLVAKLSIIFLVYIATIKNFKYFAKDYTFLIILLTIVTILI